MIDENYKKKEKNKNLRVGVIILKLGLDMS